MIPPFALYNVQGAVIVVFVYEPFQTVDDAVQVADYSQSTVKVMYDPAV